MALWLQRQEAVFLCGTYLDWISQQPLLPGLIEHHSFDSDSDSPNFDTALRSPREKAQMTHILAKVPAYPHQMVAKIVTVHSATDFLPALQTFLHKNLPQTTIIPGLHDHLDIYRQVVIIAPPDQRVSDGSKWWHVRATLEVVAAGWKPYGPPCFDMALISDWPRSSCLRTLDSVQVGQNTFLRPYYHFSSYMLPSTLVLMRPPHLFSATSSGSPSSHHTLPMPAFSTIITKCSPLTQASLSLRTSHSFPHLTLHVPPSYFTLSFALQHVPPLGSPK
ncbi:hypothetical protein BDR07DRAFT_1476948 [Suillus spraguei]|nr:hypothetical protein BDR07DRAFT_1476948 [Suillus spraguei]